jgi:hypothetical protein
MTDPAPVAALTASLALAPPAGAIGHGTPDVGDGRGWELWAERAPEST